MPVKTNFDEEEFTLDDDIWEDLPDLFQEKKENLPDIPAKEEDSFQDVKKSPVNDGSETNIILESDKEDSESKIDESEDEEEAKVDLSEFDPELINSINAVPFDDDDFNIPALNESSTSFKDDKENTPSTSHDFKTDYDSVKKIVDKNINQQSPLDGILGGDLKPLGIAEETDNWLEKILQNEAFFNHSTDPPESVLQKNLDFLKQSYNDILEKVSTAFENLPVELLKFFPGFDPDVFMTLRTTKRRIKANIIRTENAIKRCKRNSIDNSPVFNHSNSSKGGDSKTSVSNNIVLIDDDDIFDQFTQSKLSSSFKKPESTIVKSNSITNYLTSSQQPTKSLDSSFIDYTDVIYKKSPPKDNSLKSPLSSGKFHGNMRNDGATGEFDGLNFPFSKELMEMFQLKFGLKSFRTNQLQVRSLTRKIFVNI